jgi:hypothetical protein
LHACKASGPATVGSGAGRLWYSRRMTKRLSAIPIVVCIAVSATAPAAAQLVAPTLAHPPTGTPAKKAPVAGDLAKTCPEYGAGYVRLDSGTCVKIGGYLRVQGGINSR